MVLRVIGSSSSGNTYLLESESECLVLEAGLPFRKVKEALGFNVLKIVGVVGTHLHKDHFGYAEEYLKCGIPVYASEETHKSLSREYLNQMVVRCGYEYVVGNFKIYPFHAEHDVECFGYVIVHPDMGKLFFCTDSAFVKSSFKKLGLSHILIEANYSEAIVEELLSKGLIDQSRVNRVFKTHFSIENCLKFLDINKTANLDNVVLLHMSDGNSNATEFVNSAKAVVGNSVNVYEAKQGLEVKLDLFPFA